MTLIRHHTETILVRIFLIFVVPIVLLWLGVIEHEYRLFLLL